MAMTTSVGWAVVLAAVSGAAGMDPQEFYKECGGFESHGHNERLRFPGLPVFAKDATHCRSLCHQDVMCSGGQWSEDMGCELYGAFVGRHWDDVVDDRWSLYDEMGNPMPQPGGIKMFRCRSKDEINLFTSQHQSRWAADSADDVLACCMSQGCDWNKRRVPVIGDFIGFCSSGSPCNPHCLLYEASVTGDPDRFAAPVHLRFPLTQNEEVHNADRGYNKKAPPASSVFGDFAVEWGETLSSVEDRIRGAKNPTMRMWGGPKFSHVPYGLTWCAMVRPSVHHTEFNQTLFHLAVIINVPEGTKRNVKNDILVTTQHGNIAVTYFKGEHEMQEREMGGVDYMAQLATVDRASKMETDIYQMGEEVHVCMVLASRKEGENLDNIGIWIDGLERLSLQVELPTKDEEQFSEMSVGRWLFPDDIMEGSEPDHPSNRFKGNMRELFHIARAMDPEELVEMRTMFSPCRARVISREECEGSTGNDHWLGIPRTPLADMDVNSSALAVAGHGCHAEVIDGNHDRVGWAFTEEDSGKCGTFRREDIDDLAENHHGPRWMASVLSISRCEVVAHDSCSGPWENPTTWPLQLGFLPEKDRMSFPSLTVVGVRHSSQQCTASITYEKAFEAGECQGMTVGRGLTQGYHGCEDFPEDDTLGSQVCNWHFRKYHIGVTWGCKAALYGGCVEGEAGEGGKPVSFSGKEQIYIPFVSSVEVSGPGCSATIWNGERKYEYGHGVTSCDSIQDNPQHIEGGSTSRCSLLLCEGCELTGKCNTWFEGVTQWRDRYDESRRPLNAHYRSAAVFGHGCVAQVGSTQKDSFAVFGDDPIVCNKEGVFKVHEMDGKTFVPNAFISVVRGCKVSFHENGDCDPHAAGRLMHLGMGAHNTSEEHRRGPNGHHMGFSERVTVTGPGCRAVLKSDHRPDLWLSEGSHCGLHGDENRMHPSEAQEVVVDRCIVKLSIGCPERNEAQTQVRDLIGGGDPVELGWSEWNRFSAIQVEGMECEAAITNGNGEKIFFKEGEHNCDAVDKAMKNATADTIEIVSGCRLRVYDKCIDAGFGEWHQLGIGEFELEQAPMHMSHRVSAFTLTGKGCVAEFRRHDHGESRDVWDKFTPGDYDCGRFRQAGGHSNMYETVVVSKAVPQPKCIKIPRHRYEAINAVPCSEKDEL